MALTAWTLGMGQQATYWAPSGPDGRGGTRYETAPVVIACRWQHRAEKFRSSKGEEMTSQAVVYPDRVLEAGGRLALGDLTGEADYVDPRRLEGALEIMGVQDSPSIDATMQLNKVYL